MKNKIDVYDRAEPSEEEKCTNLTFLNRMTKGNPKMIKEMITVYIEETPKYMHKMKEGISQLDWDSVSRASHSFLPSFFTMGISEESAQMLKEVNAYAEKRENPDKIKELLARIEAVCSQASNELKKELIVLEGI